jgi:tetratricopeptide (TPR) repeat protein
VEIPSERGKVIGAIDRAISLEPNESYYFGLKGWFYVCLQKFNPALRAAFQGLGLNPTCRQSLNALANAHTKLGQWQRAETACLRILELDSDDAAALNLLAQALRHQGRWKESREVVNRLLAQQPNDAFGHANAGYGALAAGDHLRANEHFLEALRMAPDFDLARVGLLASLRARIWIIRWNLRIISLLHRPGTFLNVSLAVFGFLAGMVLLSYAATALDKIRLHMGTFVFGALFAALLIYVFCSVLIYILGDFFLLFDPLGRHAMTREEKIKVCMPGAVIVALIAMLFSKGAWGIGLCLSLFMLALIFTIRYPLMKDRWMLRRQSQIEE